MKEETIPLVKTFAHLTKNYIGAIAAQLDHLDINRHYYLLYLISKFEKPLTQKELATMIAQDKSSMVRIIDYLVEMGYVRRTQNPTDRRKSFIQLTNKAKAVIPEIKRAFDFVDAEAVKELDEDQLQVLEECLHILSCNLETMPSTHVKLGYSRPSQKTIGT